MPIEDVAPKVSARGDPRAPEEGLAEVVIVIIIRLRDHDRVVGGDVDHLGTG
jgi:hypothetical protein